jgi:uncharacterized protein (DUF305 family)
MNRLLLGLAGLMPVVAAVAASAADPNSGFAREMDSAMGRMTVDMHMHHAGDIDRQFAGMMIAHHQGAIDMAVAELRYGRNEQLRRIAQEIIIDQQQEIAAMDLAIGAPLPKSAPAPTQPVGNRARSG